MNLGFPDLASDRAAVEQEIGRALEDARNGRAPEAQRVTEYVCAR
jgi:hypothetical protein